MVDEAAKGQSKQSKESFLSMWWRTPGLTGLISFVGLNARIFGRQDSLPPEKRSNFNLSDPHFLAVDFGLTFCIPYAIHRSVHSLTKIISEIKQTADYRVNELHESRLRSAVKATMDYYQTEHHVAGKHAMFASLALMSHKAYLSVKPDEALTAILGELFNPMNYILGYALGRVLSEVSYINRWQFENKQSLASCISSIFDSAKQLPITESGPDTATKYISLGALYLDAGRYDDALDAFAKLASLRRAGYKDPLLSTLVGRLAAKSATVFINARARIKESRNPERYMLESLFTEGSYGSEKKVVRKASRLIGQAKDVELKLLVADYMDSLGYEQMADGEFRKIIDWQLQNMQITSQERVGVSRNQVFKLGRRCYYFFKEGDEREALHGEMYRTQFFRDIELLHEQIAKPLSLVDYPPRQSWFFVSRHAGDNLFERLKCLGNDYDTRLGLCKDAAILLARIHFFGQEAYNSGALALEDVTLIPSFFTTRAVDTFLGQLRKYSEQGLEICLPPHIEDDLRALYTFVEDALTVDKSLMSVYKDANPKNFTIPDSRKIIAIDFDTSKYQCIATDLVSLLEFEHVNLQPRHILGIVDIAIDEFSRLSGTKIEHAYFHKVYKVASLQRHLELTGYKGRDSVQAHDPAIVDYLRYHLNFALEKLDELSTAYFMGRAEKTEISSLHALLSEIAV